MKRILIALALAGIVFSGMADAEQWDYGTVKLTGKYNGKYYVKISNVENTGNNLPSFKNRLFSLSDGVGVDGFAVALAAITSKRQVLINSNVDNYASGEQPVIKIIYLTDELIPVEN